MQAIIIIVLILAVLLVIFTLQNSMEITISVFFWEISNAPLVLVLLGCMVLGYLIAAFYFYPRIWKLKREYNRLSRFNSELEELHGIKPETEQAGEKEITDPEGMELDETDDDTNTFFKD